MAVLNNYSFVCPVKTIYGKRALELIPIELQGLNAARPFLLWDEAQSGRKRLNTLIRAFGDSGVNLIVYNAAGMDRNLAAAVQLADVFRQKQGDAILVMGRGALLDMAKIMNWMVCTDSVDPSQGLGATDQIRGPLKPLVYIPIGCGSGFETAPSARIEKKSYASFDFMPSMVLLDPRLIVRESPRTTFSAAMTALAHAVNAYTGSDKNAFRDAYAACAIQLIQTHLLKAIQAQTGAKAHLALAHASVLAGCTLAPASMHENADFMRTLARATAQCAHLEYGVCLGLLLPTILEYQFSLNNSFAYDLLRPLSDAHTYATTSPRLRAPVAINCLRALLHDLHDATGGETPRSLANAGTPRYILNDIAEKAMEISPKPFALSDYLMVLECAWDDRPIGGNQPKPSLDTVHDHELDLIMATTGNAK